MQINLGLLISGSLGAAALKYLHNVNSVDFVFTNNDSSEIIRYCEQNYIPVYIGNPRKSETDVNYFLKDKHVDYIFSINYLFLVENNILNHPKNFSINLHGSLLPKYRGRTPHVWAIINGEKETGITAHVMDENCDNGDFVGQIKINIPDLATGADILEVFSKKYIEMLDSLLVDIGKNKIQFTKQDITKATYFGKRTPDDGLVNWNWQKERIRNWIRAQAYPYPGAFTFYDEQKLIIDEVEYSEFGFTYDTPNGTILKIDKYLFVKTPNGVVKLTKIRNIDDFKFEENKKFYE